MSVTQRWALCALLFGAAISSLAQDEMVLGSPLATAPGEVVRVPVFLRDVAGTPLGAGGTPIQWIDLSVTHSHPHLVVGCLGTTYPNCDLQFEAAGVLTASPPATSGTLINIASLYLRRIFNQPVPVTGGLDLMGFITFRLDPKAPLGTVIRLQFDPTKTFLANRVGTIIDRALKLIETTLDVAPCLDPPTTPTFDYLGPISGCSSVSSLCRAGEDVEFILSMPLGPCDTMRWSFGDGTVAFTNASSVQHRFTLPADSSTTATYTVTATVMRASGSTVFSRVVSIEPGCTATVPETAVAGMPVVFTVDPFPPGFFVVSVLWKFGDGTFGFGNPVVHTYQFGVTYVWEATVTVAGAGVEFPCIVRRPIKVTGPIPRRRPAR